MWGKVVDTVRVMMNLVSNWNVWMDGGMPRVPVWCQPHSLPLILLGVTLQFICCSAITSRGLIQFSVSASAQVGPVTNVTIASVAPGGWTWSLVTRSHLRHATNGGDGGIHSAKLVLHTFPSDIKGSLKDWSPMDKIFLADLLWIWGCLILERCWRESSGMRTNPGPGPAEFCANYRPNVVVILETDKSNTWHKKANKNRDLWQITARRHISPGRGQCPVWQINYEKFNGAAKRYFMLIN